MNILLTGRPGTGKTYVMKNLIDDYSCTNEAKVGLISFLESDDRRLAITGKYVGEVFDGSDKLSMAAISSVPDFLAASNHDHVIFEGDRFTNKTFLLEANPFVINIEGDGSKGIALRGSSQTEARLKAMKTRYNNFQYNIRVLNSNQCLEVVRAIIEGSFDTTGYPPLDGGGQNSLF